MLLKWSSVIIVLSFFSILHYKAKYLPYEYFSPFYMLNFSLHSSPIHEKRYNAAKIIAFNSDLITKLVYNKINYKKSEIPIIKMIQNKLQN